MKIRNVRSTILTLVIIFLLVLLIVFERFDPSSLEHQKKVGEALQPFALSIGALLSGTAGLFYLDGWLSKQKTKNRLAIDWKDRFPVDKLGKGFKVVQSDKSQGILYIYDLKNKTRHWIVNPETLRALGLNYHDVETFTEDKFRKINRGDNINLDIS